MDKKIIITNRAISPLEKIAYKNLRDYDGGEYQVKHSVEISKIVFENNIVHNYTPVELGITQEQIDEYVLHAQIINIKHSDFKPGIFAERNSYESSFAKKVYFDSELEFIVNLFISHHNIHAFEDGNKRTALNLFIDFIDKLANMYIYNILIVQDAQILYLEKKITEDQFKKILYFEVRKKMFKTNIKCNLEHLIPRSNVEDNNNSSISQSDRRSSFNLTELEKGQFFYEQLRKPIFQRDTNQWTVERLEKLILTFLDDGLIPAIILWEDLDGSIYVIDGAHRISSLIAWVNSDYGKENELNDSNHTAIEEYINNKIGSYEEIKRSRDEKYKAEKQIIAKRSIAVQWVTGDYSKVKESFIRINEQGVVITEDEKELIENDQLPTSILSRAILGHGLGQISNSQNEKTKEIFNRFFKPFLSYELNNYPLAGSINEDFVISKIYNVVKIIDNGEKLDVLSLTDKVLGLLKYVQDYLNISQKIYFYGATKKHKTNSFYGFIRFSLLLNEDENLNRLFIENRKIFEEYLVENEGHIQVIARKKRQAKRAYEEIAKYYQYLLLACTSNNFEEIESEFSYLDFGKRKYLTKKEQNIRENYEEFISVVPRCLECQGFIDGDLTTEKKHNCCD
ncbi:DUF262 domain-containing protein [Ammoniphilus sp. YIM 78166]|uniref:GmrSD restriction endonuclease domain-containing protein n=1 Tax=Ammoniphilus sp. YIM 78166 TaxID=1644106 RepID=UPI001F0F2931|nr:DUF262 domain-containing protein [Ammoniphilus sp. YIM 78166]